MNLTSNFRDLHLNTEVTSYFKHYLSPFMKFEIDSQPFETKAATPPFILMKNIHEI